MPLHHESIIEEGKESPMADSTMVGVYKGLKGKDHGLTVLLLGNRGIGGRRGPVSF